MKKLLALSLCLLISGLIFAAGSQESGETETQTVTMWTFLNPEGAESGRNLALKKIIDRFERENPGIEVVVEPQQWDTMTSKFIAAHQSGNAPDIQWVIQDQLGETLEVGAIEPFENLFLDDWSDEEIADVSDAFWKFGVQDGNHYQVSLSRNYVAIMYRKDLFEEKGIKLPITNIDQLIEVSKKLTEQDEELGIQRYGLGQAFSRDRADPPLASALLLAEQDDMYTEDGKANWATNAGVRAFETVADMVREHGITPESAVSKTVEDLYREFAAGQYAMIMGAGVRIPRVRSEITVTDPENVGFMLIPALEDGEYAPSVVSGWSVGVWSGSEVKEAAGAFVEAMFSPWADELWVRDGGQVPVRKSTISEMSDFFSQPENQYLEVMATGFSEAAYTQPTNFGTGGWRADMNAAMQEILVDGADVRGALESAEEAFNRRTQK